MKKQTIYAAILSGLVLTTTACTDNYKEYNTNPYEANKEQMSYDAYNIRAAIVGMEGYIVPVDVNMNQFMECLLGGSFGGYLADSNQGFYGKNYATYNPQQHWIQVAFNDIIPNIYKNLTQLKQVTDDPVFLSVGNIIKVAAVHRITDIYGPIPYSKIGEDGKLETAYDTQEEVYNAMFAELDEAINTLTPLKTSNFSANADKIFSGNTEKWIRFANSLKLRLAMRIVYANEDLAKQKAEEVMAHEVGPMLTDDDCAFNDVAQSPFRVVMYDYNGGDSRVSADITSYMNGYDDPRREKYFTQSSFTQEDIDTQENGYYGLRSGIQIPPSDLCHKYTNMNIAAGPSKLLLMNAAETAFLRAEGAMRGWNMGDTAENLYNEGIRLSFQQWGAQGADLYLQDDTMKPMKYVDPANAGNNGTDVSTITIKWDDSADMEQKLERIITQKWIANFPLGLEAWSDYRRTGYPMLMKALSNQSGGIVDTDRMARRLPYPQREYNENTENVQAAVSSLGGPDNMATPVWWDVK